MRSSPNRPPVASALPLVQALEETTPGAVLHRPIDRLARAHDASHYLLVPRAIVVPRGAHEIGGLFRTAAAQRTSITFRSGGTSLSGQAVSDGIMVDTRRHFRAIEVLDSGARVRVQPGATVRAVNARLAPYGRRLGPDPASEIACTIGGVIANNSSGMACGVEHNTYRTLESMVVVLPSGTVVDTGADDADDALRRAEPSLYAGLLELRARIMRNPESVASITRQYAIKNTMGYGLNSYVDFERPVDMLVHLVVGSEGTLAFIAEATFRTVPLHRHAATALLIFDRLSDAVGALPELVAASFATIELLDATSMRVAQSDPKTVGRLRELTIRDHAALLIEHQQSTALDLAASIAEGNHLLGGLPLVHAASLSTDQAVRSQLWQMRKGLYATVAGNRPRGTTALLEDIAVPAPRLLDTCMSLTALLRDHGYSDSVTFGHAKDGNLHFMLNENFQSPDLLARYADFTEDMVDLVLGNGGTLKAEHGTGRIMAPYVERQYGSELFAVMQETKRLFDPNGLLNPGVLISDDPGAHLKNLKSSLPVEAEVDRCVECGYCEPACPSADITLTPRQRIVVRREIAAAQQSGDTSLVDVLAQEYRYEGVETCAVDGMCASACPLHINTADLVRRLRQESANPIVAEVWRIAARNWKATTRTASFALSTARRAPVLAAGATSVARVVMSSDIMPAWTPELPLGGAPRAPQQHPDPDIVFFSSCTSAMFASGGQGSGVANSFLRLCARAHVGVRVPDQIGALCCGTPWKSKGLQDGYAAMQDLVIAALTAATDHGRLPIVCDASSCTEGLQLLLSSVERSTTQFTIIDAVQFIADDVLPQLPTPVKIPSLAIHPTCSSTHLGSNPALMQIAAHIAQRVTVPDDWGCCAFAGDRGMLHPELTASATRREAAEIKRGSHTAYASVNRTCELAMTRATGQQYENILEVLDRVVTGAASA